MAKVLFLSLFFFSSINLVTSQSQLNSGTNQSCLNSPPCRTYLAYFAQPLKFMSIGNISDFFGVSRLNIVRSSNLASEEEALLPGQLLLVPVMCGTYYFSNVTYEIEKDDSYYLVSVSVFENVTNWHVMENMNPTLNPNILEIGTKVVFPLFCKCPSESHRKAGFNYLISYVWQPGDTVSSVASKFKVTTDNIISKSSYYRDNFAISMNLPVLIPVSEFPILAHPPVIPKKKHPSIRARNILIITICSGIAISVILAVSVYVCTYCLRPQKVKVLERNESSLETTDFIQIKDRTKLDNFNLKVAQDKLLPGVLGYLEKQMVYETRVIMEATMNLSEHCKLGKLFYRAFIEGQLLAVRRVKDEISKEWKILQRVTMQTWSNWLECRHLKEGMISPSWFMNMLRMVP